MVFSRKSSDSKAINAWCMYDWANSAFATTILAAVFPIYYRTAAGAHLPQGRAITIYAYTTSLALLMVALTAPILGAIADYSRSKKKFLFAFAVLGIVFTALMATLKRGDWAAASVYYIFGYVGFAGSIIFYESLLPHITTPDDVDRVSSMGYAVGYLGGGLLLALNVAWILKPAWFLMGNKEIASRISFLSVAVWWAVFSIPLFRRVPEPPGETIASEPASPVLAGFARLATTLREIRQYRDLMKFLVAFWLYSDGVGTVIKMATIYGADIGISQSALIGALLLVQFVGIPFTILFGRLAGRVGAKRALFLALGIYCLVSVCGYFMSRAWHFWVLALLVATSQGGAQAISRSLFTRMVPKSKSAEFFGFYSVSSKFAGIFGPLLFALIGQLAGASRFGIFSLLLFFVAGGLILTRVDIEKGAGVAAAETVR